MKNVKMSAKTLAGFYAALGRTPKNTSGHLSADECKKLFKDPKTRTVAAAMEEWGVPYTSIPE